MKIIFVMGADIRTGRGTENVLLNLVKYRPRDAEIIIIENDYLPEIRMSLQDFETISRTSTILKIKHIEVYDNVLLRIFNNLIARRPLKLLKDIDPKIKDAIQSSDVLYFFFNMYSIIGDNLNIPVIASSHTSEARSIFLADLDNPIVKVYKNLMYKTYYKNITGFHSFFNDVAVPELKHNMVLPNGVDTKLFYPNYKTSNEKLKVVFVAALKPEKGLDILLPLIDKFKRNSSIEFHIAGAGPLESKVKKTQNIIFHKSPDNSELAEIYRSSDVFIYPSHSDTFAMVVLEALSSGLYVLAGSFFKGKFDDFEHKYLDYIPMNVKSFYHTLNRIIENRNLIDHDKLLEYEYVKSNYSWPVISDRFYDYMRKFSGNKILKNMDSRSDNSRID
ncbi:MAG: glycosyltransferase family 4 protein [Thermoplasmatales archaeon]